MTKRLIGKPFEVIRDPDLRGGVKVEIIGGEEYAYPTDALQQLYDSLSMAATRLRDFGRQTSGHAKGSSLAAAFSFATQGKIAITPLDRSGRWELQARKLWGEMKPHLTDEYIYKVEFDAPYLRETAPIAEEDTTSARPPRTFRMAE